MYPGRVAPAHTIVPGCFIPGYDVYLLHKQQQCINDGKENIMAVITATPKSIRPHLMVAEMDTDFGRVWSTPMFKAELDQWIRGQEAFGGLSDYCCASTCWCES